MPCMTMFRALSLNELACLDILRVRGEALYLVTAIAHIEDVRQHVEQAEVSRLEAFLAREERR